MVVTGWVSALLSTLPGPFYSAPAALAEPGFQGLLPHAGPMPCTEVCLEQAPPPRAEVRVGHASFQPVPWVCGHPRFAYKDEYEKFKLYLTIILILISFTCRFLLNSRWVSGCLWARPPALSRLQC